MYLIPPSANYKKAFAEFYDDFVINDPENADYYEQGYSDFDNYVESLTNEAKGINLREGYVPCSHFWLTSNTGEVIGAIRVRHTIDNEFLSYEGGHIGYDIAPSFRSKGFGKSMLKLVLPKALELGITTALITADENNIASRKVIESNGGNFDKVVHGKVFPNPIARYWVSCA
jgi:predicted acetyltransferase